MVFSSSGFGFWNSWILVVMPKTRPLPNAFTKLCPLRLELFKLLPIALRHAYACVLGLVKSQPIFSFKHRDPHRIETHGDDAEIHYW